MPPGKQNNTIGFFTIKPSNNVGDTLITTYGIGEASAGISYSNSFYSILEASPSANGQRATPSITQAQAASGKEIVYTIGFKNTTTSKILDVVILDSLSSYLRPNTVKMIAASNRCKLTVKGNRLIFQLMDISIPTAAINSLKSMGFVTFSVKPQANLVANTLILNKAYTSYNNFPAITTTSTTLIKAVITPVKLMSYKLKIVSENEVKNIWITANEINVSHYNIQRSTNGKDFVTIGKVAAKGSGEYNFTDPLNINPLPLVIYYRILSVGNDGTISYSDVKTINLKPQTASGTAVYPNPATNKITIGRNNTNKETVTITDIVGKVVKSQILTAQSTNIDIQNLEKGMYLLSFESGEKIKMIKQ